ncbi:MAG: N-acetylneuraminate synthase family protein [Desulfovibrio sp.]|nr:N-acetylneuraminate synthase family protein [Desulfovibrio sp.]
MQTIRLGSREVGPRRPAYIIAEMACAHDGDPGKALRLVEAAATTGADAVQLQFFSREHQVTPDHPAYATLQRIAFSREQWAPIVAAARATGLDVLACTFDVPSARMALEFRVDGIKLNSSDLSNPDLLELVAASGTPFTLGTGASTVEEISAAVLAAERHAPVHMVLMHGVQNFPTAIAHAHIRRVGLLQGMFGYPVGYADHTDGSLPESPLMDLLALGAGACVLEKHYTLSRAEKGVDYQAALEPAEFVRYVQLVRTAEAALGPGRCMPLSDADRSYRQFQKKSIVAARDLAAGEVLTRDMVEFMRTSGDPGLPPVAWPELAGQALARPVARYAQVRREHLGSH